jgi:hypothetical protein
VRNSDFDDIELSLVLVTQAIHPYSTLRGIVMSVQTLQETGLETDSNRIDTIELCHLRSVIPAMEHASSATGFSQTGERR